MTIDGHIHYSLPTEYEQLIEALDQTGCVKGNLVAQIDPIRATETVDVLYAKYNAKGRLYCFGALNPVLYYKRDLMPKMMVEHVKEIMACGCDGIKMLEGKPSERKFFPVPDFDDEVWEPYWQYVEENRIPIVWHVNDPEEFWDDKKVPDWARRSGWFYAEGDWVNNEDQYRQINNVLDKHPNLCIIFAHFYFLSAQLDRLSKIFEKCPNVGVDITPGIELFTNMSANLKEARNFFIKYQDRIYYGTDISRRPKNTDNDFSLQDSKIRGMLCHDFLLKDSVYIKGDERSLLGSEDLHINGLSLPEEVYEKILSKNFIKLVGEEPKKVNVPEVLKEIEREKERTKFLAKEKGNEPNFDVLNYCKEFFEKKI